MFFLHRWPRSLRFTRGRWRSYWPYVLQMSPSFFLLKTVVHLVFVSAKSPLRVQWCSVSSVEKFSTVAALQRQQSLSMAKLGFARIANGQRNPLLTRSCPCWLHCREFVFDCQRGTPCASSSRGLCDGSTESSRPAQRECCRKCQRWSVETCYNSM